jgi:hypothetical protein
LSSKPFTGHLVETNGQCQDWTRKDRSGSEKSRANDWQERLFQVGGRAFGKIDTDGLGTVVAIHAGLERFSPRSDPGTVMPARPMPCPLCNAKEVPVVSQRAVHEDRSDPRRVTSVKLEYRCKCGAAFWRTAVPQGTSGAGAAR